MVTFSSLLCGYIKESFKKKKKKSLPLHFVTQLITMLTFTDGALKYFAIIYPEYPSLSSAVFNIKHKV